MRTLRVVQRSAVTRFSGRGFSMCDRFAADLRRDMQSDVGLSVAFFSALRDEFRPEQTNQGAVPLTNVPGVPHFSEIKVSERFAKNHFLADRLLKDAPLSAADIHSILTDPRIDYLITGFNTGTIPASRNESSSYSKHSWTRDDAELAYGLYIAGFQHEACATMQQLSLLYGGKDQRDRFLSFHFNDQPFEQFLEHRNIPIVRAKIDSDGRMTRVIHVDGREETADDWGHAQLDAMGKWLSRTFEFAKKGILDIGELQKKVEELNVQECGERLNAIESIWVSAVKFLQRIDFSANKCFGAWEKLRARSRATSTAMCVDAMVQMREWIDQELESKGAIPLQIVAPKEYPDSVQYFKGLLDREITVGKAVLSRRLPDDPYGVAKECDLKGYEQDAALAFILPLKLDLTANQINAIRKAIYPLMGEVAFKRTLGDDYVGQDYHISGLPHRASNLTLEGHKEAEWGLIEAYLASWYAQLYIRSGGTDEDAYGYAQAHLKRACANITGQSDRYTITQDDTVAEIEAGQAAEAYFWDSHESRWRAVLNTPLHWFESVLYQALHTNLEAALLSETKRESYSFAAA